MAKANKYVCIHGHFYQPPRENAWLEIVELQDSAQPFHDWNERINFECYAPNAAARILDSTKDIIKIRSNYTHISFNFGPTLLHWMQSADPETGNFRLVKMWAIADIPIPPIPMKWNGLPLKSILFGILTPYTPQPFLNTRIS